MSSLPSHQPTPARPAPRGRTPSKLTRRHVVLIALLPLLIAVWIPVVGGGRHAPPVTPPIATGPPVPPTGTADTDPPPPAEPPAAPGVETALTLPMHHVVAGAGELTRRLRTLSAPFQPRWTSDAGDPFGPATGPQPRAAATDVAVLGRPEPAVRQDPELEPTAVLITAGQEPMAIIGGRTYRPGDEIAGHRIVTIEERRVVFRHGERTFPVSIPAPTLGQEPAHD